MLPSMRLLVYQYIAKWLAQFVLQIKKDYYHSDHRHEKMPQVEHCVAISSACDTATAKSTCWNKLRHRLNYTVAYQIDELRKCVAQTGRNRRKSDVMMKRRNGHKTGRYCCHHEFGAKAVDKTTLKCRYVPIFTLLPMHYVNPVECSVFSVGGVSVDHVSNLWCRFVTRAQIFTLWLEYFTIAIVLMHFERDTWKLQ